MSTSFPMRKKRARVMPEKWVVYRWQPTISIYAIKDTRDIALSWAVSNMPDCNFCIVSLSHCLSLFEASNNKSLEFSLKDKEIKK